MSRLTFYPLVICGLALFGMIMTMLTFGAYTMQDMCKDLAVIVLAMALTDCIVSLGKEFFSK